MPEREQSAPVACRNRRLNQLSCPAGTLQANDLRDVENLERDALCVRRKVV